MKKSREEIEQIAEVVVDAMLKVHRALGPGLLKSAYQACLAHELRCRGNRTLRPSTWLPRELERHSHQGRHQANGQQIMSPAVLFLRALRAFAVNLASHRPRKHHAEGEPHRSRRSHLCNFTIGL